MFPSSIDGSFELLATAPAHVEVLAARIEQRLVAAEADNVIRTGGTISFRGGLPRLRLTGWSLLAQIHHGEIAVATGAPSLVRYRLSTVEVLALFSVSAVACGAYIAVVLREPRLGVAFGILGWAWTVGINYSLTGSRFRRFLMDAVQPDDLSSDGSAAGFWSE